jgi:hypothetical protein
MHYSEPGVDPGSSICKKIFEIYRDPGSDSDSPDIMADVVHKRQLTGICKKMFFYVMFLAKIGIREI